jgi:hypothetical protein
VAVTRTERRLPETGLRPDVRRVGFYLGADRFSAMALDVRGKIVARCRHAHLKQSAAESCARRLVRWFAARRPEQCA